VQAGSNCLSSAHLLKKHLCTLPLVKELRFILHCNQQQLLQQWVGSELDELALVNHEKLEKPLEKFQLSLEWLMMLPILLNLQRLDKTFA
jgi:hypothetical protein